MSTGSTERIELTADAGAAAALAAASTYALIHLAGAVPAAAGCAITCLAAYRGLRSVRASDPDFALADFTVAPLDAEELGELILTDSDRLVGELVLTDADRMVSELILTDSDRLSADDELVLEDVLPQPSADSRVVRLFDPSTMPAAGEVHVRIDRHPGGLGRAAAPSDASRALHQALAELRRSLR